MSRAKLVPKISNFSAVVVPVIVRTKKPNQTEIMKQYLL